MIVADHCQDSRSLETLWGFWETSAPSLSSQLGFTYFLEVDHLCDGASTLKSESHLQKHNGTKIDEADRVVVTLFTYHHWVQFGVAVDRGPEFSITGWLSKSAHYLARALPRFHFLYAVSLHAFIVFTVILICHQVTAQGAHACRDVRAAADPEL